MRTRWKTIARVVKTHAKSGEVVVESVHGLPPLLAGGMEVALVPPALKTSRYHTVAHADAQGGRAQLVAFEDVASLSDAAELVGRTVLARLDDLPETVALMDRDALVGTCVRDRTLGLLGTMIWVTHMTLDVTFVHMADQAAENADLDRICFLHVVPPQILMFCLCVIPATIAAKLGGEAVAGLIGMLTGTPLRILQVIGSLLPALGIAMNLRSISRPGTLLFFVAGLIMVKYLGLPVIAIAALGGVVAYFYTTLLYNGAPAAAAAAADDDEEDF